MSRGRPGRAQVHDGGHLHEVSYLAGERYRAVRMVAHLSRDAGDCALILSILGLEAAEGLKGEQT